MKDVAAYLRESREEASRVNRRKGVHLESATILPDGKLRLVGGTPQQYAKELRKLIRLASQALKDGYESKALRLALEIERKRKMAAELAKYLRLVRHRTGAGKARRKQRKETLRRVQPIIDKTLPSGGRRSRKAMIIDLGLSGVSISDRQFDKYRKRLGATRR